MNTRQTFPQEWRFETYDECKASGWLETCVVGDIGYIANVKILVTCPRKDGAAESVMTLSGTSDMQSWKLNLEFDLRPADDAAAPPRTCLTRSHAFDADYFKRVSSRWTNSTFIVVVAAHDLGLPAFFGTGDFPWRQWASFTFWFKAGALAMSRANFHVPLPPNSAQLAKESRWFSALESVLNQESLKDANPVTILVKLKDFYEKWRQYRRMRVVQWEAHAGDSSHYCEKNALLDASDIQSTLVDERGFGHYRFFHLDQRSQALHDFVKHSISCYSLKVLVNESVPLGMEGTFDPNVVNGFIFSRARNPRLERAWHAEMLELTLALAPLQLSAYVLLWIYEWLHEDTTALREIDRVRLIQGVIESRQRVHLATTKPTR
jgi:hypothetical protein